MPRADFRTPRLYVDAPLAAGVAVSLAPEQANYLGNVLRLKSGDAVLAFNGREGEWRAALAGRKRVEQLVVEAQTRPQDPPTRVRYAFAPLKHARLDYLVQKATELGVRRLRPAITRRTIAERVNLARMRANAVEAAEQCNLVAVPEVMEPRKLDAILGDWPGERALIFCDEAAVVGDPQAALRALKAPAAVLIGPEGGFDENERTMLLALPGVTAISLGPRILRADTAAVAALTLAQACIGDWSHKV